MVTPQCHTPTNRDCRSSLTLIFPQRNKIKKLGNKKDRKLPEIPVFLHTKLALGLPLFSLAMLRTLRFGKQPISSRRQVHLSDKCRTQRVQYGPPSRNNIRGRQQVDSDDCLFFPQWSPTVVLKRLAS